MLTFFCCFSCEGLHHVVVVIPPLSEHPLFSITNYLGSFRFSDFRSLFWVSSFLFYVFFSPIVLMLSFVMNFSLVVDFLMLGMRPGQPVQVNVVQQTTTSGGQPPRSPQQSQQPMQDLPLDNDRAGPRPRQDRLNIHSLNFPPCMWSVVLCDWMMLFVARFCRVDGLMKMLNSYFSVRGDICCFMNSRVSWSLNNKFQESWDTWEKECFSLYMDMK